MCVAIYPLLPNGRIELAFALERIYLKRNGSTAVVTDFLLRNLGKDPIRHLRVAIPSALVDISEVEKSKEAVNTAIFGPWRTQQASQVRICSDQLLNPDDGANWAYRTLPYLRIQRGAKGGITLLRMEPENTPTLEGYIKQHWRVTSPPREEVDDWMWFLLAVNDISLIDLSVSELEGLEHLQSDELMWVRIDLIVPPRVKRASLPRKIAAVSIDYHQHFRCPVAVGHWIAGLIQKYPVRDLTADESVIDNLLEAQRSAASRLPGRLDNVAVKDWRAFMYREFGLDFLRRHLSDPAPRSFVASHELPAVAYPKPSKMGTAPRFVYSRFGRQPRGMMCEEIWVGLDHGLAYPKGYSVVVEVRLNRRWPMWLALLFSSIALVLGIYNSLRR